MKWETPARERGSSREPAPIQSPSATERTPSMRSLIDALAAGERRELRARAWRGS